jgi:curli biogenesis system outer membrane secretion channel CsgG
MKLSSSAGLFLLLLAPIFLHGKISYVEVEASGIGSDAGEAVTDALIEALGMVNGRSIESESSLKQAKKSFSINGDENEFLSEDFRRSVRSATKGAVAEYKILSQTTNELGLYNVVVSASVAKLQLSKSANRRRIAVFPLRLGDKTFRIGSAFVDKERIARLFSQGISTNLVQSRKFTVLDREYIEENLAEKANILYGDVKTEEMARIGQELVADMILVGTIEDFGVHTKSVRMRISGKTVTTQNAFVNFGYRILDTATKQIKFADVLELKLDPSELHSAAGNGSQGELESAISRLASEQISIKILEAIYPIVVVSARGDYLTLGQGGNSLQKGDRLEIFQYGESITDPYTGESLGREELPIGIIEITRANAKTSSAKYIDGDFDISGNFEPKRFLCRSFSTNKPSLQKQSLQESKSRFEDRRKKRSSLLD